MRLHLPTRRSTTGGTPAGPTRRRVRGLLAGAVTVALLAAGCAGTDSGGDGGDGSGGGTSAPAPGPNSPMTLRVLAGSEVRDLQPVLEEARKATGVSIAFDYVGTLEGAERVASGQAGQGHDATWFSSNRYLSLLPKGNQSLTASTKIMASPVVLGLRTESAKRLGWDTKAPTWAQIGDAAKSGTFTYGMTNPASSNSGFSALVGVATALTGGGTALSPAQVTAVTPKLTTFFSGQKLTAGSSGWLADRFAEQAASGQGVDGLVNYESVLLDLKAKNAVPGGLTLVYPADGVVSADYPLSFLASAPSERRAAYDSLVTWLRSPDAQKMIMERTHRRPVVPGVPLAPEFGTNLLVELPFPAQRATADGLVNAYLNTASRPSQTIYVIDTSGSMEGERLTQLKEAFTTLSGKNVTRTEGFTRFRGRERVTIIPFNDQAQAPQVFQVPEKDPAPELARITQSVDGLSANGGTAIYDSLAAAYEQAATEIKERPDAFTSVVLMTDGEKTAGRSLEEFLSTYQGLDPAVRAVPTFTVLFGESDATEMTKVAEATHGAVFDARTSSLDSVFKEIRGYQ